MTNWSPDLSTRAGPRYRAIADALETDIAGGRLAAGERLPTHRLLAHKLGVTVGTITRAYAEAGRRRLVTATVGRGTFVRDRRRPAAPTATRGDPDLSDLRSNYPVHGLADEVLAETLEQIRHDANLGELLQYQDHAGMPRHRAAGASWIARSGFNVSPSRVLVTAGGQHALAVAFMTLTRPGDVVLTEDLTYHNVRGLAAMLRVGLHGVALDSEGLVPEAFEAACRSQAPRALYCTPSFQNPTAAVMGRERRRRIAEIAAAHGVAVIEDDVYGFLEPGALPLAAHAPGPICYVTSVSKSLAPGLRVGYLAVPEGEVPRFTAAMRDTCWMATPLAAEIAARWIDEGDGDRLAAELRREAIARQEIARRALSGIDLPGHPSSFHLWLPLPRPWRAEEFTRRARTAGVAVMPADAFAVGPNPPQAVRLCLGAARSRAELARAIELLAGIVGEQPALHEAHPSII